MRKGFSLIELYIVIAVLAIIAIASIPTLRNFYERKTLENIMWQLAQDLRIAREKAIVQQQDLIAYIGEDEYYIEFMQYGMLQNPQIYNIHFVPGDANSRYFKIVKLPKNIKLQFISPTVSINGKNYLGVVFKAGGNANEIRGQAKIVNLLSGRTLYSDSNIDNNGVVITGKSMSINLSYSIKIMATGKISL
ncbi:MULTISPECIES: prepilin-type N-terminal cleavage/methylation domain-containing protein [Dictyoglomus]|jgi:prepilin-type N-terminal cleavage/methylation domain-containing protein|uniref:N-terminal methylation motif domain protein n=1 Tax=Dictyoglomus turgidum (strain DSM 6724 / Z-1310) TaxID=515635 RepID=B8E2W2_DICTD|nr:MULTISPECIES: prepilin-type N-terminal cleavage/methylation domain-containing protein [Dictyoglomus]ACK42462.1 N-terminal methylation motif domain protein [Dictyoglomus turgidum DSM 6724]HBU32082.1 prepilin-type cleavage/methylation domain-containing protein [Dictyoglomus sp.]